jgi:hypothetical protein
MANVVKYKKIGDINLQGAIELDALTASNVPNASSGKKTLFLDVADTTLKTKDSSGTVAQVGGSYTLPTATDSVLGGVKIGSGISITDGVISATGGGGASAPVAVTSGTLNITSSHNGKLITNAGATGDIILSLASVATLGNAFEMSVVNEKSLYNGTDIAVPSSTLLLLHGNGSDNGTTITDSSSYNRTITRDTVVTKTGEKKLGNAALYMTGGKLTFTAGTEFAISGDFTFALWVKCPADPTNVQSIFLLIDSGETSAFQFSINAGRTMSAYMNGTPIASEALQVPDNTWAHLAWIRTSGTLKGYINGVEKASGTASNSFVAGTVTIGRNGVIQQYTGYMDEMIFVPVALPIDTVYNSTKEFGVAYGITITPNSADQLPNTASVGNSVKSSAKNDFIKLRTTDTRWITESVYPAVANFVDLLD